MPRRLSGIKELRINKKRRLHNLTVKTDLRKTIKAFLKLVAEKKFPEAQSALKAVYKRIDKAAKHRIIHKNTAGHRKSRFAKLLKPIAKA